MKTSQKTGVKIGRHLLVYYASTYRIQIYCENIHIQGPMAVYRAGRSYSQLKPWRGTLSFYDNVGQRQSLCYTWKRL